MKSSTPPAFLGEETVNKVIKAVYDASHASDEYTSLEIPYFSCINRLLHNRDRVAQPTQDELQPDASGEDVTTPGSLARFERTYTPSPLSVVQLPVKNTPPLGKVELSFRQGLFHFQEHVMTSWNTHLLQALAGKDTMLSKYQELIAHHSFDMIQHQIDIRTCTTDLTPHQRRRDILLSVNHFLSQAMKATKGLPSDMVAIIVGSVPIGLASSSSDMDLVVVHRATFDPISPSLLQKLFESVREPIPIYHYRENQTHRSSSNSNPIASQCFHTPLDCMDPQHVSSPFYWIANEHAFTKSTSPIGILHRNLLVNGAVLCLQFSSYWKYADYAPENIHHHFTAASQSRFTLQRKAYSFPGPDVDLVATGDPSISKALFISTCAKVCPYTVPLILAVGQWASNRSVKNAPMGYFNSFSLYLLVIYFLQAKGLLPVLHRYAGLSKLDVARMNAMDNDVVDEPTPIPARTNPHSQSSHQNGVGVDDGMCDRESTHTSSTLDDRHIYPFLTLRKTTPVSPSTPLKRIQPKGPISYGIHLFDSPYAVTIDNTPIILKNNSLYQQYVTSLCKKEYSFEIPYGHPSITSTVQITAALRDQLEAQQNSDDPQPVMLHGSQVENSLCFYTSEDAFATTVQEDQDNLYTIDWSACAHPHAATHGLDQHTTFIGYNHAPDFMLASPYVRNHLQTVDELRNIQQGAEMARDGVAPSPSAPCAPGATKMDIEQEQQPFSYAKLYILLYEFFQFYAYVVDFRYMVPSVRLGHLVFREYYAHKYGIATPKPFIAIEDPFNTTDNPARGVTQSRATNTMYEIRRAASMFQRNVPWWRITLPLSAESLAYTQLLCVYKQSVMYTRLEQRFLGNIIDLLAHVNITLKTSLDALAKKMVKKGPFEVTKLSASQQQLGINTLITLIPSLVKWVTRNGVQTDQSSLVDICYHPFLTEYLDIPSTYRMKS